MKNTGVLSNLNPLQNLLDRPIAFHRCLVPIAGITGALMLGQAIYWAKRTSDSEGWFYKTIGEWEEETGLTRREQETAKKNLKGILDTELRGIPARLYFRINWSVLEKSLNDHSLAESAKQGCTNQPNKNGGNRQTRLHESAKQVYTNPPNRNGGNRQTRLHESANLYKEEITTETTAEITTETTIPPTPQSPPSQGEPTDRLPERGEKSPISETRDNPKEAENKTAKGDGSPSRQNTPSDEIILPNWLSPSDWNDYLEYRKGIGSPMSPIAQRRAISQLEQLGNEGQDPSRVINQSILNGWKGLFPVKNSLPKASPKTFDEIRREKNKQAIDAFIASHSSGEEEPHVVDIP
ncbi:MAG: hypothetical protein ACYCYP_12545 [Leptospirales bacterium]